MFPRHSSDYRTLLWTLIFTPGVVAAQYVRPEWVPYLSWLSCYFALACGTIAHNHNHCPTFASRGMNQFFGSWISIFYGYPTFAWIPTHNLNHHKYVNRDGDATITWRYTNRHNALVALTYFFVSSYFQGGPIRTFIRKAKDGNSKMYRRIVTQYVVWGGAHVGLLSLAIALHGVTTGLYVWVFACGIPAFFALWTIMLFNYEQHVHTDPWSKFNHSRNFDSRLLNFLLFNNGLHTAHHENAGLHWSRAWELHNELAPNIEPMLIQRSMWWYFIKQYLLALVIPSLGTKQIGRAPFEPPGGEDVTLESADVDVADAGTNAPIAGRA